MGRLQRVGAGLLALWVLGAGPVLAELAPQSPALPGLGNAPRREQVDPKVSPWSAIARLNVPGVSRCTAVMIAPRLALTAAHCVVSRRLGHVAPPSAIHVLAGYRDGQFTAHSVAEAVAVAPGFDILRPDDTRGADAALITLAAPVIDGIAALPLGEAARGAPVVLGGYSQDTEERITADTHCQVTGYGVDGEARPLLLHNCAATRGTSGAAVLDGFGAGWRMVGLQEGGFDNARGGTAVPASALAAFFGLPLR